MPRSARLLPAVARDERGSVILMSIVLVFVMTLLGLALFDLGAIENRMSLATQADLRAFEVAQAGIERAVRELQDGFDADAAGAESWADNDGVRAPICAPSCITNGYRPMTLANTSFPGGGSYAVEIMLVTMAQANATSPYPIGLNCFRNNAATPVCTNLVFVRSTGTVTDSPAGGATSPAPAGYTARKTLQVLARAYAPSVFANGVVAGTPAALRPVNGNVLISGSAQILGTPVGGISAIDWNGAAAGFRNNLSAATADPEILRRLPAQQAVCAPTATPCAAPNVYSLGAEPQVARPTAVAAITLAGNASIGTALSGAAYATGGSTPGSLAGKGPLDAVFVADGCQNSTCSDSYAVTAPSQTPFVDMGAIGRAYPENPVAPFASLTSPVRIAGATYAGGLQSYFATRAANLTADLTAAGRPGSAGGLVWNTPTWNTTNPPSGGNFINKNGVARRGRICWNATTGVLTFGVTPTGTTNNPCNAATVATAADPLLIYNTSANGWRFARAAGAGRADTSCPGTQICYDGVAIVFNTTLASPSVSIEETTTSLCPVGSATCTAAGQKFPVNDLMALITPGNVSIGATTASVSRVMGMFYAGTDLISRTAGGTTTRIVGGIAASRFCFGGGGACPGGTTNIPEFYQAPLSGSSLNTSPVGDARALPEEVLALAPSADGQAPKHWRVESVPRLWLECRPIAPSATLPITPTGVCSY